MMISRLALLRPHQAGRVALAATLTLAACSTAESSRTPEPMPSTAAPSISATPVPTLEPTATPAPTPRFTNQPDDELAALIPASATDAPVTIAPFDDFALTPGDIGFAYGDIGDRFASLALAYIVQPRLTLYAMRIDGDPVATEDLEPHLATAGRYVGIAGLDAEPWELSEAGGHAVWVRPEDNATAAGTMVYTWSSGEVVFLLIGVEDATNRALIEQLPGEPAPSPTPVPSGSFAPSPPATDG